ncbi:HEAT repeat domain-containing protein [Flavobacterium sp. ASW18X]|uniref:HEAT repeat domain-containing protein n=1 Tax=Flavobacterium sp. ASW18X TaxID=2572595 RepID=UPI0010AE558B|nr:HEAT repeat domain-containing protein [Flavobacterium sp. ASW18X]TKD66089.1 HEAT repeat domain-containing protein [Flavobacterium sp. ASW18X]
MTSNTKKINAKRAELAPIISNFLFHAADDPKEAQKEYVQLKIEIRDYLKDKQFREVISAVLFDLQKDVAGDTKDRLFQLFKELDLHQDAYKKLNSWRWETIAKGIVQLSKMEVKDSYQLIRKFINDRRSVIRKQAEMATVSLRNDGINYLLDTTRFSLSEWQQLKLMETLSNKEDYTPPQFKSWLISSNKDVVLFALRLIKHYNQIGAEEAITQLVRHKNNDVKTAAIQCLVDFNFTNAVPVMKRVFWKSNNPTKINILNAIGLMGKEDDLFFLHDVVVQEKNFLVQSKAQAAMNAISPGTVLPTKDLLEIEQEEESKTIFVQEQPEIAVHQPIENSDLLEIEVVYEEVLDVMQREIEFSEIEVFDVIEETATVGTFYQNNIANKPEEITLEVFNTYTTEQKINAYLEFSILQKDAVIEAYELGNLAKDYNFLEFIAEHEDISELRYKAFRILQQQQPQENHLNSGIATNPVPKEEQVKASIFYPLFEYASDIEAKLILLDQAGKIGTDKDIAFLKSLSNHTNPQIKAQALLSIDRLLQKDEVEEDIENGISMTIVKDNGDLEELPSDASENTNTESEERMPLELLFWNENKEKESTEEDSEDILFDFELDPEFFSNSSSENKLVS